MEKYFPSKYGKDVSLCRNVSIGQNRFPPKDNQKNMEGHHIVIKEKTHQENMAIVNI